LSADPAVPIVRTILAAGQRGVAMQLINWSGALIGPGSEWFWAAAQFVVVVLTLLGIYRQLKSQGSANALQRIGALEGQYSSPRMCHARLVLALHLKYEQPDMAGYTKAMPLLDFFTNLANLEEEGFISVKEIASNWGRSIQIWSALTAPLVALGRQNEDIPDLYNNETLIAKLRAFEQTRGYPPLVLASEALPGLLDYAIATNTVKLQQEAAWQSGVIPSPPPSVSAA